MGHLLLWTIAVLLAVGHTDAQFLSGLAQGTADFINTILSQVNDGIQAILKPIDKFVSSAEETSRSIMESFRKIAKTLQKFTNDELSKLIRDLNSAIQNSVIDIKDNIAAGTNAVLAILSDIFKDLSQIDPYVIRKAIDRLADDSSPGLTNFVEQFNLTCRNEDGNLFDEIVDGLTDYKEGKKEFNDLVKKVIDRCVLNKYNELDDEGKDKFLYSLNRALTRIDLFLNGRNTFSRFAAIKKAVSDFAKKLLEKISSHISFNDLDDNDNAVEVF